ncbi:hypothetical protein DUNSADRAFT_4836 [Dunaliella salina]|uniref:Encoded protein n=1 Tax=Dunaliella salina TaxID=3046 RepID=A0ABQ7GRA2_DUNSA|nr:hypothetical protein DUNSADRAFT_4836 [Dunaliella salina]|eukprot:KAF5837113.1 hypothetical protein DUNSADRAFT_4836 [Dunaliella salina]
MRLYDCVIYLFATPTSWKYTTKSSAWLSVHYSMLKRCRCTMFKCLEVLKVSMHNVSRC